MTKESSLPNTSVLSLGEAAACFLAGLPEKERGAGQPGIQRFVAWFGREKFLDELTAPEVAAYAQRLSASAVGYGQGLELIRDFLKQARKQGWTTRNLSAHLKARKTTRKAAGAGLATNESLPVSQRAYDDIINELASLKDKRPLIVADIKRAAADKDFRENAPLDAAREQLSYLEGRLKKLEAVLKVAVITEEGAEASARVTIGSSIVLCDLDSGQELTYTLVGPRDVDPAKGRISCASPIGKAILDKSSGQVIEIAVPAGKMRCRIERMGP
jgi:transcription elongation factor GreA